LLLNNVPLEVLLNWWW